MHGNHYSDFHQLGKSISDLFLNLTFDLDLFLTCLIELLD